MWRSHSLDYWQRYREEHPSAVERNRHRQHIRDQTRRLRDLAGNSSDRGNIRLNTAIADRLVENSKIFLLGGDGPPL